jgi:hypothetical protein
MKHFIAFMLFLVLGLGVPMLVLYQVAKTGPAIERMLK